MPQRVGATEIARRLCIERADEIGGLTVENVKSSCIDPVTSFFQERVDKWTASKILTTTVTVNDKPYQGTYLKAMIF